MRRLILLAGIVASLAATPAWGDVDMMNEVGDGMHYECVSGKLQATRGQIFNANVVPFRQPFKVCGAIIQPKVPGFFGSPPQPLAGPDCGIATPGMPYQIDTTATRDNGVEAYFRGRIWVPKRPMPPCPKGACSAYQTVEIAKPPGCKEPNKCECKADDKACKCLTDQWCPKPPPPMPPPPPPMVPGAAIFNLQSDNMVNDGTDTSTDIVCRPAKKRARRVWTEGVGVLEEGL